MYINMEYLSHFLVAAEYLNFSKAADKLFISQSTLSRQIKDLENEVGAKLFLRKGRSLSLTAEGKILYDNGQSLLNHMNQVANLISHSNSQAKERITIFSVSYYLNQVAVAYNNMKKRNYNIEISLHHMMDQDAATLLEANSCDFIISYEPFVRQVLNCAYVPFMEEGFILICSKSNHLAGRDSVTLDECLNENVLFGSEFPFLLSQDIRAITPNTMNEAKPPLPMPSYYAPVYYNEGVLILPECTQYEFPSSLSFVPVNDSRLTHNVVLAYKKDRKLSANKQVFITELKNADISDMMIPVDNSTSRQDLEKVNLS